MTPAEKQQFRDLLLNATPDEINRLAETVASGITAVLTGLPHEFKTDADLAAAAREYADKQIAALRNAQEAA